MRTFILVVWCLFTSYSTYPCFIKKKNSIYFEPQHGHKVMAIPCTKINSSTYHNTMAPHERVTVIGTTKDGLTVVVIHKEEPLQDPLLGLLVELEGKPAVIPYGVYYDPDGTLEEVKLFSPGIVKRCFKKLLTCSKLFLLCLGSYKAVEWIAEWYAAQPPADEEELVSEPPPPFPEPLPFHS